MCHCNYFNKLVTSATNDKRIWKAFQEQPLYTSGSKFGTDGRERSEIITEQYQSIMHRTQELKTQSGSLVVVVCCSFLDLCCGLRKDAYNGHQVFPRRCRTCEIVSSTERKVALPWSIVSRRRRISSSHSSSASASGGPSRLAINADANSARSEFGSRKASSLAESRVWRDIGIPTVVVKFRWRDHSAPNK